MRQVSGTEEVSDLLALELGDSYERAKALESIAFRAFMKSGGNRAERTWQEAMDDVESILRRMAMAGVTLANGGDND